MNHPARHQQQSGKKGLLPSRPLVLQRSLSGSIGDREGRNRDDLPYGITQDRKRSVSFSTIGQTSTSDPRTVFDSPLPPTKSEFILEECRRLGLGIRNLIDKEETFSTGRSKDMRESSETEAKETERWENADESGPRSLRQLTVAHKSPKPTSKLSSNYNRNQSTSKEYSSDATNSGLFSSPRSLAVRTDFRGNVSGIHAIPQNGKVAKQSELERRSSRRMPSTATTSQSRTLTSVSLCPQNSVTQNKTGGERTEVETTKPRNRTCEPQCSPLRSENEFLNTSVH